jgi:hypothetical protein
MGVIKKLAEALPNAAAKIEDLHLSACYSGKEEDLKEWRNIFPKVTTIWAYSGSAPGAYSGATVHMSRWDTATRDIKLELDRSIVAKTRKGHNVAVWSKRFGYQSKKSQVISEIVSRIRNSESMYQRYFSGNQVVMSTQTGPLREYYNELHDLIGHALVTNELRIYYLPRLKTTIRLIYFDKKIKKKFAEHHKSIIASGYKELGVIAPDFSKLSRKQCLKAIQEFEGASTSSSMNEVIKLKEELTYGLKELRSSHIPDNWI